MGGSDGPDDTSDSVDDFLRAVAQAPVRAVAPDPERVAHFRILGRIGRGGMGIVYRAEDESLRRVVALKLLPPGVEATDERWRRLLREARAAAAVTHPNIATVYEVGVSDDRIFIAMEYVEGKTLRATLAAGALPVAAALPIALEIARGLASAHKAKVIHRDLKPDNVIVGNDGHVKILDFGLAKLHWPDPPTPVELAELETATLEGRVLGTPAYMPPEQARGGELTPAADVYAFGVTLYEMVTGGRPFAGRSLAELIIATEREVPPLASSRNPDVPVALARLIGRCLAKEASARIPDGAALVRELSELSSDTPPALESPPREVRRRLPLALGASVAALALASVLWMRAHKAPAGEAAPLPAATRTLDLPPPPTSVPEAAAAYSAGIRALHDNNWADAMTNFQRAARADPAMGTAHLRVAMTGYNSMDAEERRAAFRRAVSLRATLSERDQGMLEALEPSLLRARADTPETDRRLEALSARFPLDVEIYDWRGMMHGGDPASLAPSERAIELDPADGQAMQTKGWALLTLGRIAEARVTFERCAALSSATSDCLYGVLEADDLEGKCANFEHTARRAADREPIFGSLAVVWARVGLGLPEAATREVLGRFIGGAAASDRPLLSAFAETQFAVAAGDFELARTLLATEDDAIHAHPTAAMDYAPRYQRVAQGVGLAVETDDRAAASAAAQDFLARNEAWTRGQTLGHEVDLSLYFARVAAGSTPASDFDARRKAWIDARLAEGAYRGVVWAYAYAAPALTPQEAEAALDTLPGYLPLTSFRSLEPFVALDVGIPDAEVGRVYLLAGRPADALPYLARGAASCMLFNSPFARVHAALDLARAREATGDSAGACQAYADVLGRWGNARPRSVTAEKATAGARALGCTAR